MLLPGQDVAHQAGEHDAQHGADGGDLHGDHQGVEDDVLLTPQEGVGIQRHGLGGDEELVALGTQHLVLGDGDDENEDEIDPFDVEIDSGEGN